MITKDRYTVGLTEETLERVDLSCVSAMCRPDLENPLLKTLVENGSSPSLPVQFLYPRSFMGPGISLTFAVKMLQTQRLSGAFQPRVD